MTTILPDQDHIDWNSPSIQETMKSMETTYPGGVAGYVKKAKQLLNNNDTTSTSANEDAPKKKRNLKNPAHCVHVDYSSLNSLSQLELGNSIAGNQTVFVIVAGGLGERLGAKSLKLALPVFTCDEDTFLSSAHNTTSFSKNNFITFYLSWMDHLRSVANLTNKNNNKNNDLNKTPVFIMTSDDTHSRTEVLLKEFFALRPQAQQTLDINLIKQSGVPCVCDNNGKLAVTPDGKDFILKPAGHGQVHRLILSSGLIPKYIKNGFKYISFLQDTNAGAPTTIPYSLAVMEEKKWAMSFTCIPRLPGEAIGALVDADDFRSTSTTSNNNQEDTKRRITYCVEYNVLDQLLKEEGISGGDTTAPGGDSPYSPFPGTINTLLLSLDQYYETLNRTQGAVAEFINPKYADPKLKTTFKSPARLETLMQDIALDLLDNENNSNSNNNEIIIGSCVFDRRTYFPVKNALLDGLTKWKNQGIDPHNGSQGEAGVHLMRRLLWKNFVNINCNDENEEEEEHSSWPLECCLPPAKGIEEFTKKGFVDVVVENSLPLALLPIFISEDNDKEGLVGIARHFMPPSSPSTTSQVKISRKSALVLKTGSPSKHNKIILKSLNLCGSLVIDISDAPAGTEVVVDLPLDYKLTNKGWCVKSLFTAERQKEEKEVKEAHLLRGYKFEAENSESAVYSVDASGNKGMKYVLTLSKESNVPVLTQYQSSSL